MAAKFLVVSRHHGLLWFAFKLSREAKQVHSLVWRKRYDSAWEGLHTKESGPRSTKPELWAEYLDEPELVVVTDTPQVAHIFQSSPRLWSFGPPLRSPIYACAWFDGALFSLPHWLIVDHGAWPGGLGPDVPGGATLVYGADVPPEFFSVENAEKIAAQGEKGLVRFPAVFDTVTKEWRKTSPEVGWTWLHTHAFVYSLNSGDLTSLLVGEDPSGPEKKYTTVLPVSIPPWPLHMIHPEVNVYAPARDLDGANSAVRQRLLLHDVKRTDKGLSTAGLDGLVGVACGSGNSVGMSKLQAVGTAQGLRLPEKQYRSDVGAKVEGLELMMEGMSL